MTTNDHKELVRANSPARNFSQQPAAPVRLVSPPGHVPTNIFDLITYFLLPDHEMHQQVMAESAPNEVFLKSPIKGTTSSTNQQQEENPFSPHHSFESLHSRQHELSNEKSFKTKDKAIKSFPPPELRGRILTSESTSETPTITTTMAASSIIQQEEVSLHSEDRLKRSREGSTIDEQEPESVPASDYDENHERKRQRKEDTTHASGGSTVGDHQPYGRKNKEQKKNGQVSIPTVSTSPNNDLPFQVDKDSHPELQKTSPTQLLDGTNYGIQNKVHEDAISSEKKISHSASPVIDDCVDILPTIDPSENAQDGKELQGNKNPFQNESSTTSQNATIRNKKDENNENKRHTTEDESFKNQRIITSSFRAKSEKQSSDFLPSSYHDPSWDNSNLHPATNKASDVRWTRNPSNHRGFGSLMEASEGVVNNDAYYPGDYHDYYSGSHGPEQGYASDKNDHTKVQRAISFPPSHHPSAPSQTNVDQYVEEQQPVDSWQAFMEQKDRDDEKRARASSWSPQGVSSKASSYSAPSVVAPHQTFQNSGRSSSSSYPHSRHRQIQEHYYDSRRESTGYRGHGEMKEGGNDRNIKGPPSSNIYHRHRSQSEDITGVNGSSTHCHYQYNHFAPSPRDRFHRSYDPQQTAGQMKTEQFYPPPHPEHSNDWSMYPPVPPLNEARFLPDDGEVRYSDTSTSSVMKGSNKSTRKRSSRSRNPSYYYRAPYANDGGKQEYPGHYNAHHHQQLCLPVSRPTSSTTSAPQSTCHTISEHQQFPMKPYYSREILALSTSDDENWLSEFLCFVRSQCVEVFSATKDDVASRMNSKKVLLDQVGIRCRFCAHIPHRERTGRSSSFPSSISRIYQSLTMMLRDHFTKCHVMSHPMKERYLCLKANASQGATDSKKYWVESAHTLGLVDTEEGIRFNTFPFPLVAGGNSDQHQHHSPSQR